MQQAAAKIFAKTRNIVTLQALKGKLLEKKINSFEPKVRFCDDHKNYRVMTATTPEHLREILQLRHKIFVEDMGRKALNLEVDFDRYDLMGDHIMILDTKIDKVIGTYRLMCSQFTNSFYSETEFEMSEFKSMPGRKLELGRACIHPDYRNGISLHLMWKGLARYITLVDADYLFGCSSVFATQADEVQEVLHQFTPEQWGGEFTVTPLAKYRFPKHKFDLSHRDLPSPPNKVIPPLLAGYMRAGAKVYGQPALDKAFQCVDVFTVLDMKNITPQYHSKYFQTLQ